jgi:hypothetical protein
VRYRATNPHLKSCATAAASCCSVGAAPTQASEGLPIRLRTASRTLARPFACILSFSAAMMLMTSRGALPSAATSSRRPSASRR